tara:strand:+ start:239 stop:415 length:177 start_codon:yes stop_codon:yes gene_type:complete
MNKENKHKESIMSEIKYRPGSMLGDVWVEKNKKGEVVVCIGIGGGKYTTKVIKNEVKK